MVVAPGRAADRVGPPGAARQPGGRRRQRRLGPRHAGVPLSGIRRTAALARQSGAWSPAVARHLIGMARRGGSAGARPSPGLPASTAHLEAAAGWLRRAQDATVDGGVSWGYRLHGGWAASYPETTGYIVPTYLALADAGRRRRDRRRCPRRRWRPVGRRPRPPRDLVPARDPAAERGVPRGAHRPEPDRPVGLQHRPDPERPRRLASRDERRRHGRRRRARRRLAGLEPGAGRRVVA